MIDSGGPVRRAGAALVRHRAAPALPARPGRHPAQGGGCEPRGPEALADTIVLTPTRRGARALASAFAEAAGGAAGAAAADPRAGRPRRGRAAVRAGRRWRWTCRRAIGPCGRRFELTRIVAEAGRFDRPSDLHHALALADAIGAFLDSAAIEEIEAGPDQIARLVEGELAPPLAGRRRPAHHRGRRTGPARLEELGLGRRSGAPHPAAAPVWPSAGTRDPPTRPLIAAGSTGTAPATADLLGVIAARAAGRRGAARPRLRPGRRRLGPGRRAASAGADEAPLASATASPATRSCAWPADDTMGEARRGAGAAALINEALRPAEATADWLARDRPACAARARPRASTPSPRA